MNMIEIPVTANERSESNAMLTDDLALNLQSGAEFHPRPAASGVAWIGSPAPVDYDDAVAAMEDRVGRILGGTASEAVWLLEHPPLYTAGTSADPHDLRDPGRFPVHQARRGGQYTYHGPGQRVAYVMLDVGARGGDVRRFVAALEGWVIAALAEFGLRGEVRAGRVGVWVARPDKPPLPDGTPREDKVAAIGVRLRRWVSFHGLSINVEPDLSHFDGIVPCGITGHGVTSLVDLGLPVTMGDVDDALRRTFAAAMGADVVPLGEGLESPAPAR
jgi:lipoyl(octanoyl) transferase